MSLDGDIRGERYPEDRPDLDDEYLAWSHAVLKTVVRRACMNWIKQDRMAAIDAIHGVLKDFAPEIAALHKKPVLMMVITDQEEARLQAEAMALMEEHDDLKARMAIAVHLHLKEAYEVLRGQSPWAAINTLDILMKQEIERRPALSEVCEANAYMSEAATHWADWATSHELVTMAAACLARIERDRLKVSGVNQRKRIMVAIWNSLDEKDRAAFLTYAEPGAAGRS